MEIIMKNMNSEDNLKDLISSLIIKKNTDKEFYNNLVNKVNERIHLEKISNLFNDNIRIEFFNPNELFWLTKGIFEMTKESEYNPNIFFTESEIKEITTTPIEQDEEITELVFPLTLPTIDNEQWICSQIPITTITKYFDIGAFTYDKRVQRETRKVKLKNNDYSERIKVYKKNVEEIKEDYETNDFTPTAVSLNILKSDDLDFIPYDYDLENLTLRIFMKKGVVVQIPDGFHRFLAMSKVVSDPKMKGKLEKEQRVTQVNIFYRDLTKIGKYIIQQSKGNKIKPAKLKVLDTADVYTSIANDIASGGSTGTNALFNNVGLDNEDVSNFNKYTTIDILSKAIKRNWEIDIKDFKNRRKLKEYLMKFFNEVISTSLKQFENIAESRKTSALVQGTMFDGFVTLAKKLENVDNWEEKLDDIIENTNWDLDEKKMWQEINITNLNLPIRQIKKLEDIFQNLYKED